MSIRSKAVLFVVHDDNQMVRQIAKMTSELADVISARESLRATAVIDSNQSITVALVGRISNGVSSLDFLAHLRSRRPQTRGVLLADPSDLGASIEALHSGVVDHVMNLPLRERELVALLSLPTPRPTPSVMVKPTVHRSV